MSNSVRQQAPAVVAWTRLVRIHQNLDRASDKNFQSLGLNAARFDVLARIGAREGLTQGELAESLLVTKGNVSQLVSKMEAEGLVERRADGRCQHLFLTPQGRRLRASAVPRQESLLAESLRCLDREEQNQLIRLLRKWERS